jgi:hypothetical protein
MTEYLKRTSATRPMRNIISLMMLIAAGVAVRPTTAQLCSRGCPPCTYRHTLTENFDNLTPPALPTGWLATNALGPPPLWVTSNSGVPNPPADTPPNAAFIDDPSVLSDKRLDSIPFSFSKYTWCAQLTSGTISISKPPTSIPMSGSTAVSWRSAPTVEIHLKIFLRPAVTSLRAAIIALSPPIGEVRLQVVRHGAAIRRASS